MYSDPLSDRLAHRVDEPSDRRARPSEEPLALSRQHLLRHELNGLQSDDEIIKIAFRAAEIHHCDPLEISKAFVKYRNSLSNSATCYFDPIHLIIPLSTLEAELVTSEPLARLATVRQMGIAFTDRGSSMVHTRLEHSIGAMHLAGLIAEQLKLSDSETKLLRVAALLHDIGHAPFSHSIEHARIDGLKFDHEQAGNETIKSKTIRAILEKHGISSESIIEILEHKCELGRLVSEFADRFDYLLRDSAQSELRNELKESLRRSVYTVIRNLKNCQGIACLPDHLSQHLDNLVNFRGDLFQEYSFHPCSQLVNEFLGKALRSGLREGALSMQELERILRVMGDDELVYSLAERDSRLLSEHKLDRVFPGILCFRISDMENPALAQQLLCATHEILSQSLPKRCFILSRTPDCTKDFDFALVDCFGDIKRHQVEWKIDLDKQIFFVALSHELAPDQVRAIRQRVRDVVAPFLKPGTNIERDPYARIDPTLYD